jgi:hypothetical protein
VLLLLLLLTQMMVQVSQSSGNGGVSGTPMMTWMQSPPHCRQCSSYNSPWDLPDVMAPARDAVILQQRHQQSILSWLLGGEVAALFST